MYSQTDARWRGKPYPRGRYTVGGSGCGLCAVTHVLMEQERYKNATPLTFYNYMRQYATMGYGTKWVGIENGLKHFGHKSVKTLYCLNSKSNVYKEFNKGNRMAVALMSASHKAPDRTVWTTGGHYIAFLDYKVVNGKHYFYVKDSGGRHRRGWYCVETSMGKVLKQVWIVERLEKPAPYKPKKVTVDGNWGTDTTKLTQSILKSGTIDGKISSQPEKNKDYLVSANTSSWQFVADKSAKGSAVIKALQKFLNSKGAKLLVDGICGPATVKALQRFLKLKVVDGIMGKVTVKAWQTYLNSQVK